MAEPKPAGPVQLIAGLLSAWPELLDRAGERLAARFGPVAQISETWPFDYTDYYEPQMGAGLQRRFLAFAERIPPDDLPEIKRETNAMERRLAEAKYPVPRPVNMDPGYLATDRLVLATTKDASHRIYLGRGIYAEVTLIWRKGGFAPLEWTYPDYRSEPVRAFFDSLRDAMIAPARRAEPDGERP